MKRMNIYKRALWLAVPMMIQNGITNAVSLVDNVMVGSLGTESMTAVSIAGQLIFVFSLAVFGGLSGPAIYGAQYYGQGNMEGVKSIFRFKWWISMACLIMGVAVLYFFQDNLIALYLQGQTEGIDATMTLQRGKEYLNVMLFGLLPFAVTQIYAGSLRETGESIKPMVAGIVSVITDVVLNYILIYGKFGFPCLEVRGAAIATVIARVVEMAVVIVWAHRRSERHTFLQHVYATWKVPRQIAVKVGKKTLPIFVNEFLWAGGIAALTQCYSMRGISVVAGINISNALCNLLNVVFVAMGASVGILIGQMLGASEYERAKRDSIRLMWFTGLMSVVLTLILVGLSGVFPSFYDTSEQVRSYGKYFIIITALFFPVQGFLNALYFTLRSGGRTVMTFLFDSVYSWVVSVPVAFVLCNYTAVSILELYAIVQALDLLKVGVGYVLIKKGIWVTNLVEGEA